MTVIKFVNGKLVQVEETVEKPAEEKLPEKAATSASLEQEDSGLYASIDEETGLVKFSIITPSGVSDYRQRCLVSEAFRKIAPPFSSLTLEHLQVLRTNYTFNQIRTVGNDDKVVIFTRNADSKIFVFLID